MFKLASLNYVPVPSEIDGIFWFLLEMSIFSGRILIAHCCKNKIKINRLLPRKIRITSEEYSRVSTSGREAHRLPSEICLEILRKRKPLCRIFRVR